ncbi:MAG: hypothetical protein R2799_05060 [Crocinitomicaceae bacterium]
MTLVILEFALPLLAILFIRDLVNKPDDVKNSPRGFYIATGASA